MPRFVILEHDHPEQHWDLMLEVGQRLKTWKLAAPPQIGKTVKAQLSFDHRIVYLDYEGPISGDRGTVVRWDKGSFTWQQDSEDHVRVDLIGKILHCVADLRRESDGEWRLIVTG